MHDQMKYHIRQDAGKPAYLQLYEQLRRDIVAGVLPLNTKLPSKRLLAEETGVSVITVEHAYAILCDEGYTEARQRSGYYVIYRERDFLTGSEADAREAEEGFQKHIQKRQAMYETYDPVQAARFDDALTFTKGPYACFILSDDPDSVRAAFEEAVGLVKLCNERLTDAEQKVRILTETASGEITDLPFDVNSNEN